MKTILAVKETKLPRLGDIRVEVGVSDFSDDIVWIAYRPDGYPGNWRKVPCFTRQEERVFPKTLAKFAHDFWKQTIQETTP